MITNPDITVAIAVWNQETYIRQAIESTFTNKSTVEIVIINDGSTDRTKEVIGSIELPPTISLKLINQDHSGNMGSTLAKAYEQATGRYISELGSDDYFLPNALDILCSFMDSNPDVGLCYSGYHSLKDGILSSPTPHPDNQYYQWTNNPQKRLLQNNFIAPPCALRRSIYKKVQYDPTQEINEDYLFKLELSRVTEFKQIKQPLAVLRIRSDSISNNPNTKDKMRFWESEARRKVIERHGY